MVFVEDLDKRLNLIELEEKILEFWKVENIYSQIKKKKKEKKFGDLLMDHLIQQVQSILEQHGIKF